MMGKKKNKSICPHKDLHVNVHSSIMHNSPKSKCPSTSKQRSKMLYITGPASLGRVVRGLVALVRTKTMEGWDGM